MAEGFALDEVSRELYLQELLQNLRTLRLRRNRSKFSNEIAAQLQIARRVYESDPHGKINKIEESILRWLPTDIRSIMESPSWRLELGGTNCNILGLDGERLDGESLAPITNAQESLTYYAQKLALQIQKDGIQDGATINVTLDYAFPLDAQGYQENRYADGHSTITTSKGHDMKAIQKSEIKVPLGQYFASLLKKELAKSQITNPVQVQVANDTIIGLAKAYRGDRSKMTRLLQVCGTGFNIGAVITKEDGTTELINTEAGGYSGHLLQFLNNFEKRINGNVFQALERQTAGRGMEQTTSIFDFDGPITCEEILTMAWNHGFAVPASISNERDLAIVLTQMSMRLQEMMTTGISEALYEQEASEIRIAYNGTVITEQLNKLREASQREIPEATRLLKLMRNYEK
jgi:hypothetical protein